MWSTVIQLYISTEIYRERRDSVVEYLSQDRGVAGSRLTTVTALCP